MEPKGVGCDRPAPWIWTLGCFLLLLFWERRQRPAIVVVASAGGTPQRSWIRSPSGANFSSGLKKLPRLSHVQSTVEPGLTHKATGPRVRVGQGFGGFLGLLWECHSTSQIMPWGRSHPRRSSFFFLFSGGGRPSLWNAAEQRERSQTTAVHSSAAAAVRSLRRAAATLLRASLATAVARSSREQRWASSRRRRRLAPQSGATLDVF